MPTESVKTPLEATLSRTRDDDRALAELARRQHGVVAWRQLEQVGFRRNAITVRLRSGRLHRIQAGVYSVAPRVLISQQGQWMAAVLASGRGAHLSHHTAAALWGVRGYAGGAIHVTVAHKSTSTKRIRRHLSLIPEDERVVEDGIPATSVHRTIFDLAATASVDEVVAMIKEAEYLNRWDRLSLPDLLERYPGKRGSRKVRFALERITEEPPGPKRSKLEERFAPFLRRHHLPLPRFNEWILLGAKRYRVDCHWPGTNRIAELDGWQGHGTPSAFQDDRERDRRLTAAGYTVTRLTWNQLRDEPDQVADDLRSLLASASASEGPLPYRDRRSASGRPHHPPPGE